MSVDHEPIVNQFVQLIYGVDAIDAEDNVKYAQALMIIAGADGDVADLEWDWFYGRGQAMGVPDAVLDAFKQFDWQNARLEDYMGTTVAVARILLYDAITMSGADGEYSREERLAVRRAATLMGVSEDVVVALEGIVELEASLRKARHRILRSHEY